jgi:hypothetical protein
MFSAPNSVTFFEKWRWFCLYGSLSAKNGDIFQKVALGLALAPSSPDNKQA